MGLNGKVHWVPTLPAGVADLEAEVIRHPNHLEAMNAIAALHARYQLPGTPGRLRARGLLIVGESGAGKSTALEDYYSLFPKLSLDDVKNGRAGSIMLSQPVLERLEDGDVTRVLLVELHKKPTQRSVVAAILGTMGYKAVDHWNTDEIIKKITFYADELGVEVILMDEGHNLVIEGNVEATRNVIEFVKSLLNRIGIPIVIAGLPHLLQLRDKKIDKQMARRLHPSVHLRPYSWGDRAGRTRFMGLVKRFENVLALPKPSFLFHEENAARLYVGTGGEVGWVSKYLSRCRELLPVKSMDAITMELLSEVHSSFECGVEVAVPGIDFAIHLEHMAPSATTSLPVEDDPSLCPFERLGPLWEARRPKPDLASFPGGAAGEDTSRRTLLKGKGPKPPTAFGRV